MNKNPATPMTDAQTLLDHAAQTSDLRREFMALWYSELHQVAIDMGSKPATIPGWQMLAWKAFCAGRKSK